MSPYQVIVQVCDSCGRGSVPTDRGPRALNRASVPPALRREAMARDRYRCRSAGCGRTSFLNVHHLAPKEAGGKNVLANLITLCSGCHKVLHDRAPELAAGRADAKTG